MEGGREGRKKRKGGRKLYLSIMYHNRSKLSLSLSGIDSPPGLPIKIIPPVKCSTCTCN